MNIIDLLLGNKTISPLPNPTPQQQVLSLLQGVGKNMIYNPDTQRLFPQSPYYPENRMQMKNGQLTPEEIQKVLPLLMGAAPGLQAGRAVPVNGMVDKPTFFNMAPKNVPGLNLGR